MSEKPATTGKSPQRAETARRGRGEGGVYQRGDGMWCGSIDLPAGPDGRRRRKVVYARTKDEAVGKMKAATARADAGLAPAPEYLTVEKFLTNWLETTLPASRRVRPTTLAAYRTVVDRYIIPTIGKKRLARLSPQDVRSMLLALETRDKPLSANSRRMARAVLRRALRTAEQDGIVARNVAAIADGPSIAAAYTGRTLTPEQARTLIDAARRHDDDAVAMLTAQARRGSQLPPPPLLPYVAIGLALGLRPGETLALRWADIDLDGRTLTVGATLVRVPKVGLVRQEPKTTKSRRTLPLPQPTADALRSHRARQTAMRLAAGAAWSDTDHVLTAAAGTPADPDNVRHAFQDLTAACGLGSWRPHEMRHSCASLLLAQGVPLRTIADVLGHSSIRLTSDTYAHLVPIAHAEALEAHGRALSGRGNIPE